MTISSFFGSVTTKAIFISNVFLVTLLNPIDWNLTAFLYRANILFFFYLNLVFELWICLIVHMVDPPCMQPPSDP